MKTIRVLIEAGITTEGEVSHIHMRSLDEASAPTTSSEECMKVLAFAVEEYRRALDGNRIITEGV